MNTALAASDLWTLARRMLVDIFQNAGVTVFSRLALARPCVRRRVRAWLAPLEAMVRKLLIVEAAALKPPPPRAAKSKTPAARKPAAKRPPSFNLIPELAREPQCRARVRQIGPPLLVREIWREQRRRALIAQLAKAPRPAPFTRLINRVCAVARVVGNPLPHARRLARLLNRISRARIVWDCILHAPLRSPPEGFRDLYYDEASKCARAVDRDLLVPRRR